MANQILRHKLRTKIESVLDLLDDKNDQQAWDFYPRSGFDPRFDPDPIRKSGYPEGPNPDPDSKMLDPSKPDPDPDILIFKSGYPDPDESKGMERAENKAYEIMGSLICSSLLIQHDERSNFVYLHDVVREMALWIASDFGKQKDNFIVHACVGLEEIPKVQNWNIVKRMSLMFNKDQTCIWQPGLSLTHSFVAAAQQDTGKYLRHFLLEHAKSRCFGSIGYTMSACWLKRVEKTNSFEFGKHMETFECWGISALLNLRVVKLLNSKVSNDRNTVEEFSQNQMRCTRSLGVEGLQLDSSKVLVLASMKKISEVRLNGCTFCEKKMDSATIIGSNKMDIYWRPLLFPCLAEINITRCPKLRKLPLNSKSGGKGLVIYYKGYNLVGLSTMARESISKILDYGLSAQLSGGSAGEALSMVLTSTVRCLLLILTPKMKFLSSLYQLMSFVMTTKMKPIAASSGYSVISGWLDWYAKLKILSRV
ncbi:hypothetical protein F2Q68_00043684 [Brassica cretica]|uniref:Uncharacterized protein n=1 Tax=Brassica cretica TaxID=69181 RepID=A0A8S9LIB8_BRACR|nr:hypothetical protein F2Q68_00043684 [Brassica cretica]